MSEKARVQERELVPGKNAAAYYDSGFLKGVHLELGKDYPVRIVRVTAIRAKYKNENEEKSQLRLYLHEGDLRRLGLDVLPLHLNPTNRDSIMRLLGEDPATWKGQAIILYRDKTDFGREKDLPCIRVRPRLPQSKRQREAEALTAQDQAAQERSEQSGDVTEVRGVVQQGEPEKDWAE